MKFSKPVAACISVRTTPSPYRHGGLRGCVYDLVKVLDPLPSPYSHSRHRAQKKTPQEPASEPLAALGLYSRELLSIPRNSAQRSGVIRPENPETSDH